MAKPKHTADKKASITIEKTDETLSAVAVNEVGWEKKRIMFGESMKIDYAVTNDDDAKDSSRKTLIKTIEMSITKSHWWKMKVWLNFSFKFLVKFFLQS